ncbi:Triosephosphate isomerase [Aduncisulcus paluster]|uniref:Triosephosphate isomerase n=1 Tax=Aduncisulcus paluster TaxID=2918883 RepID=A0ABQ5JU10_9EUKA|nr:Triosephosphate isomerase [Aduncisulcus paluster]
MPRLFLGGNHKCTGTIGSLKTLLAQFAEKSIPEDIDFVVAPSMMHLPLAVEEAKAPIQISAQNCYFKKGAFTGETNIEQIKDIGLEWVILGHSERRHVFGESHELIATKTKTAIEAGLKVIYCVGETLEEKEAGKTEEVCAGQLEAIGKVLTEEQWKSVVIAVEPVYAIGTGVAATPESAQSTNAFCRKWVSEHVSAAIAKDISIAYGGSVKPSNAEELSRQPDIDGFLVGGASTSPAFLEIMEILVKVKATL